MATRQYIGARYVPKFYQNSVDGSAAWESNVVYEPLTWVTLTNGHMYISKKQVPATVGIPSSNIEYWLDVGSYDGFIEGLENEIDAINETLTDVSADVTKLNHLVNRKFIFISDSYGIQTNNWIDAVISNLGLTSSDYYKNSIGGYGFAPPSSASATFLSILQGIISTLSAEQKANITDVVVGGGFNDRAANPNDVKSAINTFVTYVKSNLPNAIVHIGFIGWSFNSEFISELNVNNVVDTYKGCADYGAVYIVNSENVMHNKGLFLQESQSPYSLFLGYQYVHPNQYGSLAIAACITNHLLGYGGVAHDDSASVVVTLASGVTVSVGSNITLLEKQHDGVINIALNNMPNLHVLNVPSFDPSSVIVEVGELSSGLVAGAATTTQSQKIQIVLAGSGFVPISGKNVACPIMGLIANNRLYLKIYAEASSITQIGLYTLHGCVPVTLC